MDSNISIQTDTATADITQVQETTDDIAQRNADEVRMLLLMLDDTL